MNLAYDVLLFLELTNQSENLFENPIFFVSANLQQQLI